MTLAEWTVLLHLLLFLLTNQARMPEFSSESTHSWLYHHTFYQFYVASIFLLL